MASPPTTQIHPTEEELVPLSSSIGQLNELQFNPAPDDEVAVDAADPAVEWLKTRGFGPVPDDRFPGQLVLRYPVRTRHDDEAFKDEETSVAKEDLLRHPVRTGDHDEALKNEETCVTTVAKKCLLPRNKRQVVSKESVLWTDAPGKFKLCVVAKESVLRTDAPVQLVVLPLYPGRTGHDDEAFKDEETSVAKEDLLRHPVRAGDHDKALKNKKTSVTTVAKQGCFEGVFELLCQLLLPRFPWGQWGARRFRFSRVRWRVGRLRSGLGLVQDGLLREFDLLTEAPVWTVDREWRIQSDKYDLFGFVNNGLQEVKVDATFRSAHTKLAETTKLRLTLERLSFGVDGCAINESTTRGYFVYQIEIEAKPVLPIPLYSATPEANKFSVQRTVTSSASVTGSLNLSEPLQISVGSTRELSYSQESHRFLPARINGSSVTWKWQMLLWGDGQKFDTDNPSNFKNRAGIPHLPLDPSSVQLMKEIKETECIWEVQNEVVDSEPTLEFEIEIEIRLFAALIHKKISLGAPKKKIKIFYVNSMIKIRPTSCSVSDLLQV